MYTFIIRRQWDAYCLVAQFTRIIRGLPVGDEKVVRGCEYLSLREANEILAYLTQEPTADAPALLAA